jgi:hypothetical protein
MTDVMSEIKMMEQKNVTRLRNAAHTAVETTEMGREQLVALHGQSKTLEHINRKLDDVDVSLNQGERVLRSMTFWGRVQNFFSIDRTMRVWKPLHEDGDAAATAAPSGAAAQRFKVTTSERVDAARDDESQLLALLGDSVGELKQVAVAMSGELDAHDRLLRDATAKVDRSHARTKHLTHKARNI